MRHRPTGLGLWRCRYRPRMRRLRAETQGLTDPGVGRRVGCGRTPHPSRRPPPLRQLRQRVRRRPPPTPGACTPARPAHCLTSNSQHPALKYFGPLAPSHGALMDAARGTCVAAGAAGMRSPPKAGDSVHEVIGVKVGIWTAGIDRVDPLPGAGGPADGGQGIRVSRHLGISVGQLRRSGLTGAMASELSLIFVPGRNGRFWLSAQKFT